MRRRTPHATPSAGPVFGCRRGREPSATFCVLQLRVDPDQRTVTRSRDTRPAGKRRPGPGRRHDRLSAGGRVNRDRLRWRAAANLDVAEFSSAKRIPVGTAPAAARSSPMVQERDLAGDYLAGVGQEDRRTTRSGARSAKSIFGLIITSRHHRHFLPGFAPDRRHSENSHRSVRRHEERLPHATTGAFGRCSPCRLRRRPIHGRSLPGPWRASPPGGSTPAGSSRRRSSSDNDASTRIDPCVEDHSTSERTTPGRPWIPPWLCKY